MARWKGTTTQRGYGASHAAIVKQRRAAHRPGDPCAMGGEPLWQPVELLDVPHDHVNGGYLPGLACREHNRSEGAMRGNRARGFVPAAGGSDVRCQACGKPYHYAARNCEMCGSHYHPTYGEQRTCSRTCGLELKRRNGTLNPPRKPRPACKRCGKPCRRLKHAYCSPECVAAERSETRQSWPSSRLQHYTCRYCGKPGVAHGTGALRREVCPARECQLARLAANNLIARQGFSREAADAQVAALMGNGTGFFASDYGRWQANRW